MNRGARCYAPEGKWINKKAFDAFRGFDAVPSLNSRQFRGPKRFSSRSRHLAAKRGALFSRPKMEMIMAENRGGAFCLRQIWPTGKYRPPMTSPSQFYPSPTFRHRRSGFVRRVCRSPIDDSKARKCAGTVKRQRRSFKAQLFTFVGLLIIFLGTFKVFVGTLPRAYAPTPWVAEVKVSRATTARFSYLTQPRWTRTRTLQV